MIIVNGFLLILVGVITLVLARDRKFWMGYAIESFRFCAGIGYTMLGCRLVWIFFFGDELGISLWSEFALFFLGIGQVGLLLNYRSSEIIKAPDFVKRVLK